MTMESPVRICLGAALVVQLLLLSSITVSGNAIPHEPTATTIKDERLSRFPRTNGTWARKPKTPDVALNELHPKESVSEEHTEKNAKYKDRGRVRFNPQAKSTTTSPLRRVKTSTQVPTEATKLIIVTPTPEVKKPAQIIDSMRVYKKTKMPVVSSSTTIIPVSIKSEIKHEEEEYEDEEDEEDKEAFEKFTSSKFNDNFFTIPNYNDDFSHDSDSGDNKVKSDYSRQPYGTFSSYFPEVSYGPRDNNDDEPFKAESFFSFDSELTTPKNDFFDKKYEEISKSIQDNLASIKTKQPQNTTNVFKIVKENNGMEKLGNGKPTNKSTVIIKNTKEIRLLDNEEAGTTNKELSDVQGTSIYYEMSVLSTETYINHSNDDDCDNDTLPEPTVGTSSEEEIAPLKATQPTLLPSSTRPNTSKSELKEAISTLSSNYLPFSSVGPTFFSTINPGSISISTQNSVSSTEKTTRLFSSNYSRNRNYSKRLNFTGAKDSPNSVTSTFEQSTANPSYRIPTRKFHYTTPKNKPIWMAPRRNVTRTSYTRSTAPTTIYSEHFSAKDKLSTTVSPQQPSRTSLTTVPSDIDPVLQSDVSGVKKIVHSQSISDNSIPTLWKRGSTKYSTSTATSSESDSGVSDLEIPPTLTAWALASLRSPPSHGPAINTTISTQKSVDENELQKVGEVTDNKKEATTTSTTVTTPNSINNDVIPKKIIDIEQNRLPWRPILSQPASSESQTEATVIETKPERLPAESNISIQSSAQPSTTVEPIKPTEPTTDKIKTNGQSWIPVMAEDTTTDKIEETIPPVDATKSTGFESITKLPAGLTTPYYESIAATEKKTEITTEEETVPTSTDYEITTIRFSYVPTEIKTKTKIESTTTNSWHPVFPTRTKATTIIDEPITTYRPIYMTTTDMSEEITTIVVETTPPIEVSSQIIENITETVTIDTTEVADQTTTEETTTKPTTTTKATTVQTTIPPEETTTVIVEVVTEINTERQQPKTTSSSTEASSSEVTDTETPTSEVRETDSSSEENSGSNEVITQETTKISPPLSTTTSTTTEIPEIIAVTETTEESKEPTTQQSAKISDITTKISEVPDKDATAESTTDFVETTKTVSDLEDLTNFSGEVTTEASSRVLTEEAGSGAAVAIAVSTIGVIALILLIGLLNES